VKAANFQKQEAELLFQQTQSDVSSEIETMYSHYLKTQKSLYYYKTSALLNADLITKQSSLSYQKGEINLSQHNMNLQQAEEIKQNYIATLFEYNKSVIYLEYLSGAAK
jgi:cobalt-zinc-cadmium resistance protein CzcA